MPLAKKMGNPFFFFEIGPHLHTAPEAFLNRSPQNILILIEIEPLVKKKTMLINKHVDDHNTTANQMKKEKTRKNPLVIL